MYIVVTRSFNEVTIGTRNTLSGIVLTNHDQFHQHGFNILSPDMLIFKCGVWKLDHMLHFFNEYAEQHG